ncbi:hypothetical protein BJ138DRAFT_1106992 [Hygrophoropsis aurantiaca]|uniref:Uncharacterized protein n=1 Tax=Hygrophoropsis aurantiaca TaxID=72124 RepID=A0ACB7ZSX1_9AGAM|nr:hypothetical protein BJ138DRAFT_1106992 [Hygrophoropsis aurantiaca]
MVHGDRSQTIPDGSGLGPNRSGGARSKNMGNESNSGDRGDGDRSDEQYQPRDRPEFEDSCVDVVEKFKRGHFTFIESISQITRIIIKANLPDEDHETEAINEFTKLIKSYKSELEPDPNHADPDSTPVDLEGTGDGDTALESDNNDRGKLKESDRTGTGSTESDRSDSSFGSDGPSKKRKRSKLDMADIYRASKDEDLGPISKSLEKTNYLLDNWSSDPKEMLSDSFSDLLRLSVFILLGLIHEHFNQSSCFLLEITPSSFQ